MSDLLDSIKTALAAVTVHLLLNPADEPQVRAAAEARDDLPLLEFHVSKTDLPPRGQMYVWTGDHMSGTYSIHNTL